MGFFPRQGSATVPILRRAPSAPLPSSGPARAPLAVRDGVQLRRLDQLRARRTHAHPPPPAHRTLGRRPYAVCDGLCWQFRHCLVAGTNRKLHVCPGRYGTVVGSRVRGRSRDARPGVSSLLPVTCCRSVFCATSRSFRPSSTTAPHTYAIHCRLLPPRRR